MLDFWLVVLLAAGYFTFVFGAEMIDRIVRYFDPRKNAGRDL